MATIPTNLPDALALLVAQDVDRWGEGERTASAEAHASHYKNYGLALNAVAGRAQLSDSPDADELRAAADRALTAADRRFLARD